MSYTDMDIEMKALSMLGESVPDEDAGYAARGVLRCRRGAESRLRRGASSDEIGETFVTASAMLAISMYMELGSAHSGGVSGFTAGKLIRASSAERRLRRSGKARRRCWARTLTPADLSSWGCRDDGGKQNSAKLRREHYRRHGRGQGIYILP